MWGEGQFLLVSKKKQVLSGIIVFLVLKYGEIDQQNGTISFLLGIKAKEKAWRAHFMKKSIKFILFPLACLVLAGCASQASSAATTTTGGSTTAAANSTSVVVSSSSTGTTTVSSSTVTTGGSTKK